MQLDELKKNMSVLEQILSKTNSDIRINIEASQNAQTKILKNYRLGFTSTAILALVFALQWISGTAAETFPSYMKAFLVVYLAAASLWYVFMYFKLRSISISALKPAQLFSRVAAFKLLNIYGEIALLIALAVFVTLFVRERIISDTVVLALFLGLIAVGFTFSALFTYPKYIGLFRALTTLKTDSDSPEYGGGHDVRRQPLPIKWVAFGGIAAVTLILVSVAIYNPFRATGATLPAQELVVKAMEEVANAREHRVVFSIRASRSNDEDAYKADFDAEMVNGTLYLSADPGDERIRVVFDDPGKTVVSQSVRLNNLIDLNSVIKEFKHNKNYVFTERGDDVIVTTTNSRKGNGLLKFSALFSRKDCKLKSVTVTSVKDGQEKIMLRTHKIEYR